MEESKTAQPVKPESIKIGDKTFPLRTLTFADSSAFNVSNMAFTNMVDELEDNGVFIDEVEHWDNKLAYFVDDEEITLPDSELYAVICKIDPDCFAVYGALAVGE